MHFNRASSDSSIPAVTRVGAPGAGEPRVEVLVRGVRAWVTMNEFRNLPPGSVIVGKRSYTDAEWREEQERIRRRRQASAPPRLATGSAKIRVANLPRDVTPQDVCSLFSQYDIVHLISPGVRAVRILMKKNLGDVGGTSDPNGQAVVETHSPKDAQIAKETLDGVESCCHSPRFFLRVQLE